MSRQSKLIRSVFLLLIVIWTSFLCLNRLANGQDNSEDSRDRKASDSKQRLERSDLEKKVLRLSADLDSNRQAIRDGAESELIELGPSVVEFLPAIGSEVSAEWRMRIERIRDSLGKLEMQGFSTPSSVSITGSMTGREALKKIAEQTGNAIILGDLPNLDREVVTEFEATPFWEAFDDVLDQIELTVAAGDGETLQLVPRAASAPLRISAAGYSGVFRFEPLSVQKTLQLQDPNQSSLQIQALLSWEPRLVPVFVKFPIESMELICDDGQVLQSKMTAEETEFVPAGGSQLQVALDFILPERRAKKINRWNGKVNVSIPGKPATLEFDELLKEGKKTSAIGNLKVVLEKARKNRDIYEVLIAVSLNTPGQSAEAFRGWTNSLEAFMFDKDGKRYENVGWSTTRMNNNEIGLSYLFDIEKGLEGCKFMYRAPGAIVEQTAEFVLEDVPLP